METRQTAPRTPKNESPISKRAFDRRTPSDEETPATSTEVSSSFHTARKAVLFAPSRSDILPVALLLICTIICLTAALLSYFLVQSTSATSAHDNLADIASQTSFIMQH